MTWVLAQHRLEMINSFPPGEFCSDFVTETLKMLSVSFHIPQTGGAASRMQLTGALASRDGDASITRANVSSARTDGGRRQCDTQPYIPTQHSRQDAHFKGATHWSPAGRRRNRVNARVSADAGCAQRYMLYQRFLPSQHSTTESSCRR